MSVMTPTDSKACSGLIDNYFTDEVCYILTLILLELKVISLCHQYRAMQISEV